MVTIIISHALHCILERLTPLSAFKHIHSFSFSFSLLRKVWENRHILHGSSLLFCTSHAARHGLLHLVRISFCYCPVSSFV